MHEKEGFTEKRIQETRNCLDNGLYEAALALSRKKFCGPKSKNDSTRRPGNIPWPVLLYSKIKIC